MTYCDYHGLYATTVALLAEQHRSAAEGEARRLEESSPPGWDKWIEHRKAEGMPPHEAFALAWKLHKEGKRYNPRTREIEETDDALEEDALARLMEERKKWTAADIKAANSRTLANLVRYHDHKDAVGKAAAAERDRRQKKTPRHERDALVKQLRKEVEARVRAQYQNHLRISQGAIGNLSRENASLRAAHDQMKADHENMRRAYEALQREHVAAQAELRRLKGGQ